MLKNLSFDWVYTVYGDKTPVNQAPLVLKGSDTFYAEEDINILIIKESIVEFIKFKCKQRVYDEFVQYDSVIVSQSVDISNIVTLDK